MTYDIQTTRAFDRWLKKVRDRQAVMEINTRLRILADMGHFGDHKALGEGIGELRMMRTGYRIYYAQKGDTFVFLLGGSAKKDGKRAQDQDIKKAQALWKLITEEV